MFDAHVVGAFEEAAGVRLVPRDLREYDRIRAAHPGLRRLENYDSPTEAIDRFGGHFTVRLYLEGDWPDKGLRDNTGLERQLPERGAGGYQVSASARRANVELMLWADASEITPEAQATWALLTTCLRRL